MTGAVAGWAYRQAFSAAAAAAGLVDRWPGAPAGWREASDRLGRLSPAARATAMRAPVWWLHAASVGELRAARPLLAAIRGRWPGRVVLVTSLTNTGRALAGELSEVDVATLMPLDAPGPLHALLAGLRVEAFCFTETEIWPGVLETLAARGIPAFMVSGRVSQRTLGRARWVRPLFSRALARVECCMQSAADARRVIALGADPARVHVTGSLKFEHVADEPPDGVRRLASSLDGRPVLVGGSTHAGEETVLLAAYRRLVERVSRLVLLVAPRHPGRVPEVAAEIAASGFPVIPFSGLAAGEARLPPGPAVVLLDVMGPLGHCYALGVAGFVGGSLVPVGGHNVLEPARAGRPVLVGPHTASAADAVQRILQAGGGRRVASADDLVAVVSALLDDPGAARDMGERARAVAGTGEGVLARHLAVLEAGLGRAAAAP